MVGTNAVKTMKIKRSASDRAFDFINVFLIIIVLAVVIYPLYFIIIASFSDPKLVASGQVVLFPKGISLDGYRMTFQNKDIWRGYANSLFYTVLGTSICLTCTVPAAYALSRRDLIGRGVLMKLITFTMFFSGGLIPSYLLIQKLKIYNTIWALTLPFAVNVYNLIIARSFMTENIPMELHEAAQLDGCGDFKFFFRVVIPLAKPVICVLLMMYAVEHWNSYFYALIYLKDRELFPLQMILRELLIQTEMVGSMGGDSTVMQMQQIANMLKYCVIIVSSLPLLILYPFVQKYFEKGLTIGAVKG